MQEVITNWSSLTVFPGEQQVYSFLQAVFPPGISGYYINLGQQRGAHVTIFLQDHIRSEILARAERIIAGSRRQAGQQMPVTARELFMDLPDGEILRNWKRLRAEPFLYFPEQTRKVYYQILQVASDHLAGQTRESFEAIRRNKVSFCYNLVLLVLACAGDVSFWATAIEDVLQKDMAEASAKLDRDPEPSLQRSFQRNQSALMSVCKQVFEDRDMGAYGAFRGIQEGLVCLDMSSLVSGVPLAVLLGSLINDIYDVVGIDQALACTYFLRSVLAAAPVPG